MQELKINYRFIPKCVWPTCIIKFVVFHPFEQALATALGLLEVEDRFLSQLFPGVSSPTKSKDISLTLCQDTSKFLGGAIGLRDWRQITVTFLGAHKDTDAVISCGIDPDNQI